VGGSDLAFPSSNESQLNSPEVACGMSLGWSIKKRSDPFILLDSVDVRTIGLVVPFKRTIALPREGLTINYHS